MALVRRPSGRQHKRNVKAALEHAPNREMLELHFDSHAWNFWVVKCGAWWCYGVRPFHDALAERHSIGGRRCITLRAPTLSRLRLRRVRVWLARC